MHLFFMKAEMRFSNSRFNFLEVFWEPISRASQTANAAGSRESQLGEERSHGRDIHGRDIRQDPA